MVPVFMNVDMKFMQFKEKSGQIELQIRTRKKRKYRLCDCDANVKQEEDLRV